MFNYCIAYKEGNQIFACLIEAKEIHFGSTVDAKRKLKFAQRQDPDKQWVIIRIG